MITRRRLLQASPALLLSQPARALSPWHGGGTTVPPPPSFVFSYPPPAHLTPINSGEDSFSLTNAFGTFAWTNHQVEDPGPGPSPSFNGHEQYGMWFVTLTPAGGGAAQQLTLPNGLGAFSMAQDGNGTVYLEQGDSIWYAFLGWSLTPSGDLTGNPVVLPPAPLDVPTVTGPFVPSPDGTTITTANPSSTVTSLAGRWTWGSVDVGTDRFLLLNGATIHFSASSLTINAQGNAFMSQSHTGSNKVWLGYTANSSGSATPGPIPTGVSFAPSLYSNQTSCQFPVSTTCVPGFSLSAHNTAGTNHAGTLISTITTTTSDGSTYAGTYLFFQTSAVSPAPFRLVGNQVQLDRALNNGDLGITLGGPLFCFVQPQQNGVIMNAGWNYLNVVVLA